MDFGIARVLGAEQKTVDFRLMGTPAYMSPEQVLGEEVDGRSDLYSVGVLFYRLLTGALPFAADTALGMLQRQIRDTPIPLCAHRSGLPDWCETIVQRALAKAQGERFQSAEEFREALSRATGPLPMADLAKTFAANGREGDRASRADGGHDRSVAAAAASCCTRGSGRRAARRGQAETFCLGTCSSGSLRHCRRRHGLHAGAGRRNGGGDRHDAATNCAAVSSEATELPAVPHPAEERPP